MAEQVTMEQEKLAQVIAAGIAAGLAQTQAPRKIEFGEYEEKRLKGRPELTREYYQADKTIDADSLTADEINLLNRISRSGLYIDKLVAVTLHEEGGGRQSVHIVYNNRTPDQRNDMLRRVPSFVAMLEKIVAAQDAENLEEQQDRDARKAIREGGTFGNNKAYRDAKAAADARAANG